MNIRKKSVLCVLLAGTLAAAVSTGAFAEPAATAEAQEVAVTEESGKVYENAGLKLTMPAEYDALLVAEVPQDSESGMLFSFSEKASVEAAKGLDYEYDGAGWIFGIARVGESEFKELAVNDIPGANLFAKDADGNYYLFCHPTDVRIVRADNDAYQTDIEDWGKLNQWAWDYVRNAFLAENPGLIAVTVDGFTPESYIARALYVPETEYTVSTTEFGPADGKGFDASGFAAPLLFDSKFEVADGEEAPDGEYVVLTFPQDNIRFDFFLMEGKENYVREVSQGEYETLYKVTFADGQSKASEIMHDWYYSLITKDNNTSESAESTGAGTGEWTAAVLSDTAVKEQYPYCRILDINKDGVNELFVSTTEKSFIGNEDKACLMAYVNGEVKTLKEIGGAGGEGWYYDEAANALYGFSRLSGERHIVRCSLEDGELKQTASLDYYAQNHYPEDDTRTTATYLLNGEEVSEEEGKALFEAYEAQENAVTFEAY